MSHAFHRNVDFLIDQGQGFLADAKFFRTHHEGGWQGVVGLAEVDCLIGEVGSVQPKPLFFQYQQAAGRVAVADQLDPALGTARGVVELGDPAMGWHRMGLHHANSIARAQDGGDIVRLVDTVHEDGQIGLTARGNGANSGFAFGCHDGMVAVMNRALILFLFAAVLATARPASASEVDEDPDFDQFMQTMQLALDTAGSGNHPGDRSELYRYTDDGWQMQMMTVWDGEGWLLLALRLHHPDRIEEVEGQWQQRYDRLLMRLNRDLIEDLRLPELFDVPAPGWNPALPGELRSRRFTYEGFWYEARWINYGGVDDFAEWALRSYELVALP